MYYGIIETESLENRKILDYFNILKSYGENHPEDEITVWTINKISVNEENALKLMKKLSESISMGWYSLIWDKDFVYIIFRNKIFKIRNLNPFDFQDFEKVIKYGASKEIKKIYFDNLRNSIDSF